MARLNLLALPIFSLIPTLAMANVVWRGDFETGNLSQWSKTQLVNADRAQVVTSPVSQGRYALKITVRQGDDPISSSGNRNELVYLSYEPRGTERYYRWQTMWDQSYPSAATWQLFTQWHHSGSDGSPPMEFYVNGETVYLRINASTVVWTTPLVRGKWHDFILHAKWSPDPSEGFIELWYDGALVVPKRGVANQFSGMTNYLKQGLYRNNTISKDGIIYHDGFTIGETMADVQSSSSSSSSSPSTVTTPSTDTGTSVVAHDAGTPTAQDAGTRVVHDTGTPAAQDAGTPAPVDAGHPAPVADTGTPATVDSEDSEDSEDSDTPPTTTNNDSSDSISDNQALGCGGTAGALLSPMLLGMVGLALRRRYS